MATYTRVNWQNKAAGGTKLGATNLNVMDAGIDAIYALPNAKGDLIVATAADTLERLAVGSNDQVLVADSAQASGVKWAAVPGTSAFVAHSLADAKGDLIVATAADTFARLAVGSNDQVLTADSAQASGVKWATPASAAAFASYTPTWSSSGTPPSLGNGTLTGAYIELGDLVVGYVQLTIGSTSSAGTGTYTLSLPVTASVTTSRFPFGFGLIRDTGTAQWSCIATPASSTTVEMYVANATANHPVTTNTVPMTPATGDTYQVTFAYRAA